MSAQHDAYVHSYKAAGQLWHRPQCRTCLWHGISSGDKERATSEAADHSGARVLG
jgi:hypothetical protein